jgi:hypothetical protein
VSRQQARFLLFLFAAVFQFARLSQAQVPGIMVSKGTHISSDSPQIPFAETFLAINPRDDKNLIAASMVVADGSVLSYVYASQDGGRSWQRAREATSGDSTLKGGGDPVVYFDADGVAFFGSLQHDLGFTISRSNDGGFTWDAPLIVPGGNYDREYIAFDNSGGKFNGRMYAGGGIRVEDSSSKQRSSTAFVFSTDKGRTFSPPRIFTTDWVSERITEIGDLLVTTDGKLIVPLKVFSLVTQSGVSPLGGFLGTIISEDGGLTFSAVRRGPTYTLGAGFRGLQSHAVPRTAIDVTHGRYKDRIYLTWSDFDGKKYVVKVSYSSDLGKTWSKTISVNDNANDADPSNPAVAVNKDGIVAVVWNDRRDDPKNVCYQLYYAVSINGGETFLPNVKASDGATCPQAAGNWALAASTTLDSTVDLSKELPRPTISILNIPERWPNGGDTQGLVAGSDGVFHSAWINGESGVMQLWSKELAVDRSLLQLDVAKPRKDLSRDLTLEVSGPTVDFMTHTLSVKVRLVNPLPIVFQGPFSVILDDIQSSLKDMRVLNSDNGLPARGAAWNFKVSGGNSLAPKQRSEERIFSWKFTGALTDEPESGVVSLPLWAHFVILGQSQP